MSLESRLWFRYAAASLVLMGLWFGGLVPLHPNILTGSVARDVLDDPLWRVTHTAMFFTGLGGIFAAGALVSLVPTRSRLLGTWLFAATVVAGVSTAATGLVEAATFPILAERAPEVLAFDGELFFSPWFALLSGPWLLLPLCLAAFGVLAYRDGTHRRAGLALAIGGVFFFGPGMWFVPVVGPLSCFVFGAALLWWAAILWRGPTAADAADRARSAAARAGSPLP